MDIDFQDDSNSTDKYNNLRINKSRFKRILNPVQFESRLNSDSRSSINDSEKSNEPDFNNNYATNSSPNLIETDVKLFCICRSTECEKFMIACDKCNEWYHGDCIGVKISLSHTIKKFYCHLCRKIDTSLKIKFEAKFKKFINVSDQDTFTEPEYVRFNKQNLFREKHEAKLYGKMELNIDDSPNSKFYSNVLKLGYDPIHLKAAVAIKNRKNLFNEPVKLLLINRFQCLGPNCDKEAIKDSKYCSNECGIELAKKRLVTLLPNKIERYDNLPSFANQLNEIELNRINSEINELKLELNALDNKHSELDALIQRCKQEPIDANIEKEIEKSYVEITCVTCGNALNESKALKHMGKCFIKVEMQSYYGLPYKPLDIYKPLLCCFFNPINELYCTHLKRLCPEHNDDYKKLINDDLVCGCPLANDKNILEDLNDRFCRASSISCTLHFRWEKIRRVQIDFQKLRICIKLEELIRQKKNNEDALLQRGGLLSVLLHDTINN